MAKSYVQLKADLEALKRDAEERQRTSEVGSRQYRVAAGQVEAYTMSLQLLGEVEPTPVEIPFRYRLEVHISDRNKLAEGLRGCSTTMIYGEKAPAELAYQLTGNEGTVELWEERLLKSN